MSLKFSVENILNLESTSQSIKPFLLSNNIETLNFAFNSSVIQQKNFFKLLTLFIDEKQINKYQINNNFDNNLLNNLYFTLSKIFLLNQTNSSKELFFTSN